ncbi:MAG TPA: BlaI/MecI/CopY family transcriptional regulator [Planctomycetaceae bacterium]|nr:BlaI/MecI/CopY family transcriptional regulator [Planctomycetaceae bacterium]
MPRPASSEPTTGELEILQILWDAGPLALSQLCEKIRAQRPIATTTVATMLKVMLNKQLVRRARVARGSLWSARLSRKSTANGMLSGLVDRLFNGSAKTLVAHLIEEGRLTAGQRREILDLLRNGKGETP